MTAPFVRLDDLLVPDVRDRLAQWARVAVERIGPDPSWYPASAPGSTDVLALDDDLRRSVADAVVGLLPLVRRELGLARFPLGAIELVAEVQHAEGSVHAPPPERDGVAGARHIEFVLYPDQIATTGLELLLLDPARDGTVPTIEVTAVANSIVFFASTTHHETALAIDGAPCLALRGWVEAEVPKVELDPVRERIAWVSQLHCRHLPRLSAGGFEIRPMPTAVHDLLTSLLELRRGHRRAEEADRNYHLGTDNDLVDVMDLSNEILAALQPLHERFSGTSLVPTALYGLRDYREGSKLAMHVDRIETHIVSSVLQVAQDVDEPWPLQLEVDGTVHEIVLAPGQLLLYEGASTMHGRVTPLRGRSYVNAFAHYRPVEWDWTEEVLLERAAAGS